MHLEKLPHAASETATMTAFPQVSKKTALPPKTYPPSVPAPAELRQKKAATAKLDGFKSG
jgi:hypothetical protein